MSSDADLRQRVRGLLQNVVDDRKYQQGSLMYPIRGAGAYIGGKQNNWQKFLKGPPKGCKKAYDDYLIENGLVKPVKLGKGTNVGGAKFGYINGVDELTPFVYQYEEAHNDRKISDAEIYREFIKYVRKNIKPNYRKKVAKKKVAKKKVAKKKVAKKKVAKKDCKIKRCPKGTYRHCMTKGSGNIYDYNYGDGLMEDEYENENGYGGVGVGGVNGYHDTYSGYGGVLVGGRYKNSKVTKNCQIKKKKVSNPWICYVKKFARANKISYGDAISKAKSSYAKLKKGKGLGNMFYN